MQKGVLGALVFLSLILAVFVSQEINLTTADLGRHLKNGEIMLHAGELGLSRGGLLHTNFYSYTETGSPFLNHHWGTGVIFYLVFSIFGWAGVSLFHTLVFLAAFALMFLLASRKLPTTYYLLPTTLFLIPLIGDRTEVRPETLSYLFLAVFIYLLTRFIENNLSKKFLYALPLLMILWANIHIYFVFGLFVIGAYTLEMIVRRDWEKVKFLLGILGLSIIASAVTPFGPKALLYPFTIFGNYGYKLVENQSISFLENISFYNPSFIWWKISAVLAGIATAWSIWKKPKSYPIALGLITLTFGVLSFLAIRNFSIFGLVMLPYIAYLLGLIGNDSEKSSRRPTGREPGGFSAENTSVIFPGISEQTKEIALTGSIIVSLALFIIIPIRFSVNMPWSNSWGVGLLPNINASADFVSENKISGSIFSNYDIGGYLIFHEYPREKVFVDNRPEAYSEDFFKNIYIPMQEDENVWQKELSQYNFDTIWFYRLDYTPWSQEFLIARVQDPAWAPVYVDNYVIIFLRRTAGNKSLVDQYELPKSLFNIK